LFRRAGALAAIAQSDVERAMRPLHLFRDFTPLEYILIGVALVVCVGVML